ncbi:GMC family oxidoreductase [Luteimonas terrae]|uniref:Choline dehydrogenase-like flavoprotein n=1 Tax=Luteimonas terrae TaxID=1530191 RepID=A0ABU1Y0A8_9GAMM|nr:GMC family oxidoreductase [Luteimonas terrae]MDR7193736.1 choline dehydrogenase-like flavoprotein [Luteimonas terrae]
MFLDALDLEPGGADALRADICIVGAGAAGITMALQLIGSGYDVLLLEAGGRREEPATQALYAGQVRDEALHPPPDRYRVRRFGGSTTLWGGRCIPFDPIDFEPRAHVPDSGWPIAFEDVLPYYPRANTLCEAGRFAYTASEAFAQPPSPLIAGFHSRDFDTDALERFSRPTDFGARYGSRLEAARNVRVLLHANVTALEVGDDGAQVRALQVRTLTGKQLQVRARHVVLAAGGLEVARLLLASRDVHPRGIGNAHDVVGRYYMCHLAGTIGTVVLDGPVSAVNHGYQRDADGIYCRRRFALSAESQRRRGVGNFIARLHHPRITDPAHRCGPLSLLYLAKPFIPYEYAKRLHGDGPIEARTWWAHLRNLVGDLPSTVAFGWHLLTRRTLASRKFPSIIVHPKGNRFSLDFHAEQQPNRESRVTLSETCDALGMPQLLVDWRHAPGDVQTVRTALAVLARDMHESGAGRLDYDPDTVEAEMLRYGAYGGHHIGTARMGTDPQRSVVDSDCRVHGMENLYVAGAAAFPTSSQANPTLTIVALALRLAEHLQARLVEPAVTCAGTQTREAA